MSASAAHQVRGEIETPRPLRTTEESCMITGWCLLENRAEAPPVRLASAAGILPMTARTDRTDVPRLLPGQPAGAHCGFVIEGRLPAGVHLASFEVQYPDGSWHGFKTLSLAVSPASFVAEVESPATAGPVGLRVHVEGWAFDRAQPIKELTLRYGHQEIPCTLGGKRSDVPLLHPDAPQAAESGFISKVILSAGRGPLRLKARRHDGSVALARTALTIEVRSDEHIGPEINLAGERIPLPGYSHRPPEYPAGKTARPLNVLFVLHGDFTTNSAQQVCALANELAAVGHDCAIAVPRDLTTFAYLQAPRFRPLLHAEAVALGGGFGNEKGPDIIHAWTTRELVRLTATEIQRSHGGRLVVQLEDNEQEILAQALHRPWDELRSLPAAELNRIIPVDYSHPVLSGEFVAAANGVTVIIDSLRRFVPEGKSCATVWPAADSRYFYPRPVPAGFRAALQLDPATTVLFYHGNAHAANAGEMRALYTAVLQLNRSGHPTRLIRAGADQVDFLGPLARATQSWVLSLGSIHTHRHLPPLMALADIFVQPGSPDPFNDFRFPSKLPEFFSIGRPVVLPRANLGTQLRHRTDAYVLERADADGIAAAVVELRQNRGLYDQLSRGAVAYAERHFSWRRSAETLAKFYSTLTT